MFKRYVAPVVERQRKFSLASVQQAVVMLKGSSPVSGEVTFEQSTKDGPVTVSGTIQNLDPSSPRGFHIQWVVNASQLQTCHLNIY